MGKKINKVLITVSGSAGTMFLSCLLTEFGLDIGINKIMISFFAYNKNGSGICRGIQISEKIPNSMVYDPTEFDKDRFKNDICIWVKCQPNKDFPKHSFADIVDGTPTLRWVRGNPKIGVIAASVVSLKSISVFLKRDDVILIPHHHCNFENYIRPYGPVKTIGYVGCRKVFRRIKKTIEESLIKNGFIIKYLINPKDRISVINFFKSIDIQISFRDGNLKFKNSLKLSNSGSFKIPTISYPEESYELEYGSRFLHVNNITDIPDLCKKLRDNPDFYKESSEKLYEKSKEYHIDKIIPLYEKLIYDIKSKGIEV